MSDAGGLTVLDGSRLRDLEPTLPEPESAITGAQLLDVAESHASIALLGLKLPQQLKSSALQQLNLPDVVSFHNTELDQARASSLLKEYLSAIADELNDDPLVVSILDGHTLKLFLEDEDDFAMLAENLFTDLDIEDKGKINKSEIQNALVHMGVEMGIPPFSEFPLLNDIIKRHGAEGEGELGQAQFAEILQPILQELADALVEKPVVVIQNINVFNGSKLRKVLANEKQLNDCIEKIWQEKLSEPDGPSFTEIIRNLLEKNANEMGLPPSEANEAVDLLYESTFADVDNEKSVAELEKGEVGVLLKEIIEKFAEQLEANPVFHELDN